MDHQHDWWLLAMVLVCVCVALLLVWQVLVRS